MYNPLVSSLTDHQMNMLTLYQFAISHYCEKVRRYCYHYMLQESALVIPLFTQDGPSGLQEHIQITLPRLDWVATAYVKYR